MCFFLELSLTSISYGAPGRLGSGRGEPGPHVEEGHDPQADTMAELVRDKVLLHGTLDVEIIQAENLPNMDMFSEKFRQFFSYLTVCKAPFVKANSKVGEKGKGKLFFAYFLSSSISSYPLLRLLIGHW